MAETEALRYLRARGLIEIGKNVLYRQGELDLIMRDDCTIVFVEVRWRSRATVVCPAGTIDDRKQHRIRCVAQCWLKANFRNRWPACRFDVMAGTPAGWEWIKGAF